ncbi:hypothetical protein DFJ73DRAFT_826074 [Zopfochytrium polystomum]|nr:hypothetical protein DFJ73DRAFT_826074 [Zopfochytrium polystomum]
MAKENWWKQGSGSSSELGDNIQTCCCTSSAETPAPTTSRGGRAPLVVAKPLAGSLGQECRGPPSPSLNPLHFRRSSFQGPAHLALGYSGVAPNTIRPAPPSADVPVTTKLRPTQMVLDLRAAPSSSQASLCTLPTAPSAYSRLGTPTLCDLATTPQVSRVQETGVTVAARPDSQVLLGLKSRMSTSRPNILGDGRFPLGSTNWTIPTPPLSLRSGTGATGGPSFATPPTALLRLPALLFFSLDEENEDDIDAIEMRSLGLPRHPLWRDGESPRESSGLRCDSPDADMMIAGCRSVFEKEAVTNFTKIPPSGIARPRPFRPPPPTPISTTITPTYNKRLGSTMTPQLKDPNDIAAWEHYVSVTSGVLQSASVPRNYNPNGRANDTATASVPNTPLSTRSVSEDDASSISSYSTLPSSVDSPGFQLGSSSFRVPHSVFLDGTSAFSVLQGGAGKAFPVSGGFGQSPFSGVF